MAVHNDAVMLDMSLKLFSWTSEELRDRIFVFLCVFSNVILFLQCFDTVGWVIWPVKSVPDMTYNVFGGTLSLTQSINQ